MVWPALCKWERTLSARVLGAVRPRHATYLLLLVYTTQRLSQHFRAPPSTPKHPQAPPGTSSHSGLRPRGPSQPATGAFRGHAAAACMPRACWRWSGDAWREKLATNRAPLKATTAGNLRRAPSVPETSALSGSGEGQQNTYSESCRQRIVFSALLAYGNSGLLVTTAYPQWGLGGVPSGSVARLQASRKSQKHNTSCSISFSRCP